MAGWRYGGGSRAKYPPDARVKRMEPRRSKIGARRRRAYSPPHHLSECAPRRARRDYAWRTDQSTVGHDADGELA